MTRTPVIVCLDRNPTEMDARRLRPGGRAIAFDGDLDGPPGTLVGVVGETDVPRAIGAALRGWDLVVRLDVRGERRRLVLEDLNRIGDLRDGTALGGRPMLDPLDDELLDHLAAGSTLRAAARAIGLSDRTAARRLARLRDAMGTPTTTGLLARCRG